MPPEEHDHSPMLESEKAISDERLKAALKAVPTVRLAQGILGIVVVIATIQLYNANFLSVAISVLIMFGLIVGLQLLIKTVNQPQNSFRRPSEVMIWSIAIFIIIVLALTISSLFFQRPRSFTEISADFYKNPLAKYEQEKQELTKQVDQLTSERNVLQAKLSYISDDRIRLRIAASRLPPKGLIQDQCSMFLEDLKEETKTLVNRKTIPAELGDKVFNMFSNMLAVGAFSPMQPGLLAYIHDVLTKDTKPEEKFEELRQHVSNDVIWVQPKKAY